jgi:hypothetical protein
MIPKIAIRLKNGSTHVMEACFPAFDPSDEILSFYDEDDAKIEGDIPFADIESVLVSFEE